MKMKTKDELIELYVEVVNKIITYLQNNCVHVAGEKYNIYEIYGQKSQLEDILGLNQEKDKVIK